MTEKVTKMRLKVDLQCPSCYKKVKKILCKFPQIRDQVYDEKENLVTITVVCCSPEKFRDKLCCKCGKCIKSIEIVVPKPDVKPSDPAPKTDKTPKAKPDDPKPLAAGEPKPCSHPPIPVVVCCVSCLEGCGGGPCRCRCRRPEPPPRCDGSCGHGCGCRRPLPPPRCCGSCGHGTHGCGCGCGCRYSHCDYFSEQNTADCTIM